MLIRDGYLSRKTTARVLKAKTHYPKQTERLYRDWYLVKSDKSGYAGWVSLDRLNVPKTLIGKRIRLKVVVEVIDDGVSSGLSKVR